MAEMDFIMHSASDPPLSSSHQHQHQHHSQSQGCPYFRSDHGHSTSLPNPHSQYSHPPLHAHAHSAYLLPPSSNNRGAANPHAHAHPHSLPHSHPHPHLPHAPHPHSHYDPVHAASGAGGSVSSANTSWYPPPSTAPFQWPAPVPVPLAPHPHSSLQLPLSRPGPNAGGGPSSEPYFAGVGGVSVPVPSAGALGVGPGPIQPGLLQSQHQHQLSPHNDPFGPYTFAAYRHQQPHPQQPVSTHHLRFAPGGQAPPPQSNSHALTSHHSQPSQRHLSQQNSVTQQSQQPQPTPSQLSQSGDRQPQPTTAGTAAAAPRISLPALNPFPNPAQPAPPTMSANTSSGESSPAAPPASRTSLFASPDDSPRASQTRASGGGNGPPSSSSSSMPPQPHRLVFFNGSDHPRADAGPSTVPDADPLFAGSAPPVPPNTERRRGLTARLRLARGAAPSVSDDSDEDPDIMDSETEAISFLEQFTTGNQSVRDRDNDEFRIRAHQILRGQMTNKRVASGKALSQLQTVDLSTLDESERTCVICYNEFGVPNPEGINEAALRLPNCRHIFGDHCIKKWFEESDSCPYCRDKVPSELAIAAQGRAFTTFLENYNRARLANARPLPNAGEPYVRIIPTSTEPRYDSSPPRTWQTGERRSPPSSDGMDTRRRTRPRHGSFRGSPSTSTTTTRPGHHGGVNSTAPSQASPARERVGHPFFWPSWHQVTNPSNPSLTYPSVGQFMPSVSNPRAYGYNAAAMGRLPGMPPMQPQVEPLRATPSQHSAPTPMGMSFGPPLLSPMDDHARYTLPPNGAAGASSSEANHLPPPQMNTYPQLPPMGGLDGPSYAGSSNAANSQSTPAEPWLQ